MNEFKIALLQIAPTETLDGNLAKGIDACKKAKKLGADLAVFPEMWSNGYSQLFEGYFKDIADIPQEDIKTWQGQAVKETGDFILAFSNLAKELEMAIGITFLEKSKRQPLNTIIVFDRFGKKILKYSKVHTVDFKMEYFTDGGTSFDVGELDYGRGTVRIGSIICYDRNHPEAARISMLNGAEIIIIPNACELYTAHLEQMRVRASENAVVTLMVNYPGAATTLTNKSNGKSCAYYPMIRDANRKEINPTIIEMGNNEEIGLAKIDIDSLREYRKISSCGNSFRRPNMYGKLLCKKVNDPFNRKFARR